MGAGLRLPVPIRTGLAASQLPVVQHLAAALRSAEAPTQDACRAQWRTHAAGTLITHASMEVHAMHSGTEPLLAAYLWQGDLSQGARLVDAARL